MLPNTVGIVHLKSKEDVIFALRETIDVCDEPNITEDGNEYDYHRIVSFVNNGFGYILTESYVLVYPVA